MAYTLREMLPIDLNRVLQIMTQNIDDGGNPFINETPTEDEWLHMYSENCRWVIEGPGDSLLGWGAIKPVGLMKEMSGVGEVNIYIDSQHQGKGLGTLVLQRLVLDSEKHQYWTLQSSTFPDNLISLKLHQKLNFRIVGTRDKLVFHKGVWKDVVLLERRSTKVGV